MRLLFLIAKINNPEHHYRNSRFMGFDTNFVSKQPDAIAVVPVPKAHAICPDAAHAMVAQPNNRQVLPLTPPSKFAIALEFIFFILL